MTYTVLIVDDEPNAREYLNDLVTKSNTLQVVGICSTGNEAIEFCKTLPPDIILLDIQMPGKNGIETAKLLMKNSTSVIVFTTAYDQYAIQAFEVNAIGYLLKPFSAEQFSAIAKRAIDILETTQKAQFNDKMKLLFERYDQSTSTTIAEFVIQEKGLEIRVLVDEINYIISDSEYVTLCTDQKKYLKRLNLKMLTQQLPSSFLRVHRSIIINKLHIKKWQYLNNGTYSFYFKNGEILKSSRSYQADVQEVLSSSTQFHK